MSTGTSAPNRQDGGADAQQKAQELAGQAQEKARQTADQAQEKARETAEQAKGRLREQIDERSSQAAAQINDQASDLRAVGQSLREQGKDSPADAADKLAEHAEKIGGYLRDNDSEALLNDVEDFARRQPWAVAAGALALGFAAARFLKASSAQRYSSRSNERSHPAATGPVGPTPARPGTPGPGGIPQGI